MVFVLIFQERLAMFTQDNQTSKCSVNTIKLCQFKEELKNIKILGMQEYSQLIPSIS